MQAETQGGVPMQARIIDFLTNALTDPRVAAEEFPFDRPTLGSEPPPAQAPRKLKAKVLSSTRVRLRWKFRHKKSDATKIQIQAKPGDGRFKNVATVTPEVKKLVLEGLEPGATYTFRARARGPSGKSAWSNQRTVT